MSAYQLEKIGLKPSKKVYRNLDVDAWLQEALERNEGKLANNGALVVSTGKRTGRSPEDRFIVEDAVTKSEICWGKVNKPVSPENFEALWQQALQHLAQKDLFLFDGFAGADKTYQLSVRVIAEKAWHALFAQTLFLRPNADQLAKHIADYTILDACTLKAEAGKYGAKSDTFIGLDFTNKRILLIGTEYAGEVKKSIFAIMNYLLPKREVMSMHCSANVGANGDTALFFGLSGTGKTTLSADPARKLIGDDEHGWNGGGVFNIEGGCYAKAINLSQEAEPQIWNAIGKGSVLENVVMDAAGNVNYADDSLTENTRATYPVEKIPNCILSGQGSIPQNIFFLTCDAYGVLPPISKLTPEMAMYHFLSGYTAKVAGTEAGVKEPTATFSACFGAPFMPLNPSRYAHLLGDRMRHNQVNCWLVNTGWSGGSYGTGKRMKIQLTRSLLTAALNGTLEKANYTAHPVFQVLMPNEVPGVESNALNPRNTWDDKAAYDAKAKELAAMFTKNFAPFAEAAGKAVVDAGPLA